MKIIQLSIALAAALLLSTPHTESNITAFGSRTPVPAQSQVEAECVFQIKGRKPAGLKEFHSFQVHPLPGRRNPRTRKYSGEVHINRARKFAFEFASVTVNSKQINFTTISRGGVRYAFDGSFLSDEMTEDIQDTGQVVAEGVLSKTVNGRKVAEHRLQFTCVTPID